MIRFLIAVSIASSAIAAPVIVSRPVIIPPRPVIVRPSVPVRPATPAHPIEEPTVRYNPIPNAIIMNSIVTSSGRSNCDESERRRNDKRCK